MSKEFTAIDQSNAKCITTLICAAKMLQNLARAAASGMPAGDQFQGLMNSMITLWGGDGVLLEQEAVALAARLGFQVEQMQTGKGVN